MKRGSQAPAALRASRLLPIVIAAAIPAAAGIAAVSSSAATFPAAASQTAPQAIVLHAGHLFDGTGAELRPDVGVVLKGIRIDKVEAWDRLTVPPGARVVDLTNATLVPGLIDCHDHLTMELGAGWEIEPVKGTPTDAAILGTVNALRTLRAGFTTVRNVGDRDGESISLRNAIASGLIPGPRMLTARRMLTITGGHGDWNNGFRPGLTLAGIDPAEAGVCDSPDACRLAVRTQVKYGADLIKISATGGVLSAGDEIGARQFSDAELQAIVSEAHELGRKVAAHAHGTEGIKAAVRAGVDSIEHGSILDDEAVRLMKERGTWLVPTLVAGEQVEMSARAGRLPEFAVAKALAVRPKMTESFRRAVQGGVKIAFGTDSAVSPHGQNAHEFELMVAGGMKPAEALRAATSGAATLLGRERELGTIAPGMLADLVAVPGNPLEDIAVMKHPVAVFKDGAPVDLGVPAPKDLAKVSGSR